MAAGLPTAPSGERAPDLIEPLLGYRFWRVARNGALRCVVGRDQWSPGVNRATCWRRAHDAPGRLCLCGFNALHELPIDDFDEYRGAVLGAIAAWGSVDVHRLGFRAQFAQVIALAGDGVRRPPGRGRLERAARRFAVPLVPAALLPAAAERQARPLDPSLLPGRRRAPQRVWS